MTPNPVEADPPVTITLSRCIEDHQRLAIGHSSPATPNQ